MLIGANKSLMRVMQTADCLPWPLRAITWQTARGRKRRLIRQCYLQAAQLVCGGLAQGPTMNLPENREWPAYRWSGLLPITAGAERPGTKAPASPERAVGRLALARLHRAASCCHHPTIALACSAPPLIANAPPPMPSPSARRTEPWKPVRSS